MVEASSPAGEPRHPPSPPSRGPRIFLHVGSPKTGTTFLQQVLWSQRAKAAEQGLLLPMERFNDHFLASLDVRGLSGRPEHPPRAVGMWQRVVQESLSWDGTVLISHELFASATAAQAEAALAAFGSGTEVHVVLTARDLLRQIPAEWQEHVKHRSTTTLEQFVAALRDDESGASWFWRVQDYADVVRRWGAALPPERVHVVTVPPAGADPGGLWTRFATLLGLRPEDFDTESSRSNSSLGLEQAELLRRVNAELGPRLPIPGPYARVGKNILAHQILAIRPGTRLMLSRADADYAARRSAELVERLEHLQVDVVGDLGELVPVVDPEPGPGSGQPTRYPTVADEVLATEGVAALASLLTALADRLNAQRRFEERLAELEAGPLRFALKQASERHPVLGRARRLYQRRPALLRPAPRAGD